MFYGKTNLRSSAATSVKMTLMVMICVYADDDDGCKVDSHLTDSHLKRPPLP